MTVRICLVLGLIVSMVVLMAVPALAQNKPIQLALVTPIQIFPEETPIGGVRLNLLYGRNAKVSGVDLGLVNHTTTGLSVGWQYGLVGVNDADFLGFQDCVVNVTKGRCEGFQWGFVNYTGEMSGVQLGFVNYTVTMKGLQVGLVNIIKQGGQFPVFPIVNWSF